MSKCLFSILMLFVIFTPVWALNDARLLAMSKSGQTVLFNVGSQEGINQGDYAVILKEIRSLDTQDLRLIPAAKAKNIKLNSDASVWILYKIYEPEFFVKGEKFQLLAESVLLSGRRDPRLGRVKVVAKKDKIIKATEGILTDDRDRLSRLKDDYREVLPLHKTKIKSDSDFELVDVDEWKPAGKIRYPSVLYRSAHAEEFKHHYRLELFENLVASYLTKVNDPDFSYAAFYDEQMRDNSNNFRKKSTINDYDAFVKDRAQKSNSDIRLYRALLEKGEGWSEDFSDEELRTTLNQVSVLYEKDRRKVVMSRPNRYALGIDYGVNLSDAQTDSDESHRRESRYSIEGDFEMIPFLKHEKLERLTLTASFRINKTAFESNNSNVDVDETSVSAGVNWYPIYSLYTIEAPVLFLGTFIRSGFASVNSPGINEKGNYTVLSLPGFRGGLRYLLKNNIGLRITGSMETLNLERYESSEDDSDLPSDTNLVEGKLAFGMSYSF